ncbi:hypothetical protein GCM10027296_17790 [Chitinimonas naiadis]
MTINKWGFYNYRLLGKFPILENQQPPVSAGDMVVFYFPKDTSVNYVKRVVGLPGDKLSYKNKILTINGKPATRLDQSAPAPSALLKVREALGKNNYQINIQVDSPVVNLSVVEQFPHSDTCQYREDGFDCTVPAQHYFVLGDNRDNSNDSRYWGYVPATYLIGKVSL